MWARVYTLKALTDIWTGDADRGPDRTITTGLLGSIRWWFEIVVRGLGGDACDPTKDGNRCPDRAGRHCVVCELFGCTGWARKFRLAVLDQSGKPKTPQIKKGDVFQLRFTPLRAVCRADWVLLDLTLGLIAEFAAIGGKTVYKPSDEPARQNKSHHRDYGLVELQQRPENTPSFSREVLAAYVREPRWRRPDHDDFAWASLANFWCVKGKYLARQGPNVSSFNKAIGRKESKGQSQQLSGNDDVNRWLAGSQQRSKKIFSFKEPPQARRTFGFVKPGTIDFSEIRQRLKTVWTGFPDQKFLEGNTILGQLLPGSSGGGL